MKRLFSILAITGIMAFGSVQAQEATDSTAAAQTQVEEVAAQADEANEVATTTEEDAPVAEASFTQKLKQRFVEGGPGFMGIVLLCLILGLAIAIERIIYLNLSTTNTKKLVADVEDALKSGGVNAAKEVCRNTSGPVASIYYQGLDRYEHGVDSAEKAVVAYGGVQMGQLEKKCFLDFFIYRISTYVRIHGNCNWYD